MVASVETMEWYRVEYGTTYLGEQMVVDAWRTYGMIMMTCDLDQCQL